MKRKQLRKFFRPEKPAPDRPDQSHQVKRLIRNYYGTLGGLGPKYRIRRSPKMFTAIDEQKRV
jgi:hypothetical protein